MLVVSEAGKCSLAGGSCVLNCNVLQWKKRRMEVTKLLLDSKLLEGSAEILKSSLKYV